LLAALAAGVLIAAVVGAAFGITAGEKPALLAAGAVVAIAMSQLLLQTSSVLSGRAFLIRGLGLTALVSVAYFALHALFETALRGSVLPVPDPTGSLQSALDLALVGVFLALLVLQQLLKYAPKTLGDGIYTHLYNGLYIDVYITRILERVWPSPTPEPESTPAPFAAAPSQGG
jgi:NAD(P)H-quinone oxidoreductase subunit 5